MSGEKLLAFWPKVLLAAFSEQDAVSLLFIISYFSFYQEYDFCPVSQPVSFLTQVIHFQAKFWIYFSSTSPRERETLEFPEI